MKIALAALVTLPALVFTMPQQGSGGVHPLDSQTLTLKAEYDAIGPQLAAMGIDGLKDIGIDLNSLLDYSKLLPVANSYSPVDIAALKAGGYTDLAARLEKAGVLSLEAGKKGLVALKKVIASDLTDVALLIEAQKVSEEASAIGLEALSILPTADSVKPGTVDNLRKLGLNRVADSLAGVEKALKASDKGSKFLKALSVLGDDVEGAAAVSAADAKRTPAPLVATPVKYSYPIISTYPYYG